MHLNNYETLIFNRDFISSLYLLTIVWLYAELFNLKFKKETKKTHRMFNDISVIIPIYNEEQIIPKLYERLQKTVSQISENYELIFVNDGSKDHSLLELLKLTEQDHRVFYINFSRNFDHQIAVTSGLDACIRKSCYYY